MATYTNFKVSFFDDSLSALGSTTNIIYARYKLGIDTIGEGEFAIPLADTPTRQYIAKYNVATFTCQINGSQVCFGEIVIDRADEVIRRGEPGLYVVKGLGRLSKLKLDRMNYQVISDGSSGATSTAQADILALSQYAPWSSDNTVFGGLSYVNASAFLVTANETILEAYIQALSQNNHHVVDIPGRIGTLSADESLPENRVYNLYRMDALSSSTVGFSGPHFKTAADSSPSVKEMPILSISKIVEEKEVVTKAIVHGGGFGSGTFTMSAASGTKTAPSGFTYDFTNSTITNDTLEAVSNQPRKVSVANLSNIKPDDPQDATSVQTAAEQLTDAGQLWIEERAGGFDEYYRIRTVVKETNTVTDQIPLPGAVSGARLEYSNVSPYNTAGSEVDTTIIDVDKVMHILEAEFSVTAGDGDENNKLIANYLLGPAPRQERSGDEMIADEIKELKRRLDHAEAGAATSSTPAGSNYVKTDAPLLTASASAALANERAGANGLGTVFTDNGAGATFQISLRTPTSVGNGSTNTPGTTSTGHTHAIGLAATDLPTHVIATNTALGSQHSISGATAGQVLRASGATTANFQALSHSDLTGVNNNDHHEPVTMGADTAPLFSIGAGQTLNFDPQTANTFLAGPASGGAADPTMRAIVFADVPSSSAITTATAVIMATDSNGRHQVRGLGVGTAANENGAINVSGRVLINETASTDVTTGLVINQGGADNSIIALKSSEVAHGMTDVAETDTFGFFGKSGDRLGVGVEFDAGGLLIVGLRDSDGGAERALVLSGYLGEAASTTTNMGVAGSSAVVQINGAVKSGTDGGIVADDGNLLAITNYGRTNLIVKGNGDTYQRGELFLTDDDVAHGMTSIVITSAYMRHYPFSGTDGGAIVAGYSESVQGLGMFGVGTTSDTTKTAAGSGAIEARAYLKSGTSAGAHGSNANLFVVRNATNTLWIVDAEGDTHRDGSDNTFDTYHDAHLARAFDRAVSPGAVIDSEFDAWVQYGRKDLIEAGILHESGFYNESRLLRLAIGAVWQEYTERQRLTVRVAELEQRLLNS